MLEAGTYLARAIAASVPAPDTTKSTAVMLYLTFRIEFEDGSTETIRSGQCLFARDGSINTITCENLNKVFGWDYDLTWWENPDNFNQIDVELVLEHQTYTGRDGRDRTGLQVKYINKPGEGNAGSLPESAAASLMKTYGAKLRAYASTANKTKLAAARKAPAPAQEGTKEAPAEQAPAKNPPKKPAAPPVKGKAPEKKKQSYPASTQDEAWESLTTNMAGQPQEKINKEWFRIIESVVNDKPQDEITPDEWGTINALCADDIPF